MSSSLSLLPSPPAQTSQTVAELLQKYCGDDVVPYKGGGVKLTDVNPHLVCVLCHGYFVDATSIVECLHSFCRSCIVLHLDKHSFCPICREDIQNSKALKPDKALQDIVYKLVPGLFHSEMKRRQEFYQKHPHRDMHLHPESRGVSVDRLIYTADELISLSLEYYDKECEQEMWKNVTDDTGLQYIIRAEKPPKCVVRKRYLKCPAAVRMSHLKKFIRLKYNLKSSNFVELLYRRESLPEEYSIMDIAYIYTWNRNEPMRFFYKINARVTVPVIPMIEKQLVAPTDAMTTELKESPNTINTMETTPLPPKVKLSALSSPIVGVLEEQEKTGTKLTKLSSVTDKSASVEKAQQRSITESTLIEPVVGVMRTDVTKKDRQPSPLSSVVVPMVPLNAPISPEGTSKKENVSDNVRNSCANDPEKTSPTMLPMLETKKSVDLVEQKSACPAIDEWRIPMKKLEKLVDHQQKAPLKTVTTSITTATSNAISGIPPSPSYLPKKAISVGESKLNLSISKLIMKNQNAAAAAAAASVTTTKFVPTLQQMQQIGMHTSIPTVQQQSSSLQSKGPVRPGYSGVNSFKRTQDILPARSQAPTNRPPFIPVRKSYEWNKARNLAAKPHTTPMVNIARDSKIKDKTVEKPMMMSENQKKSVVIDRPPSTGPSTNGLSVKNSDEMNAAQSLLKVGQDIRLSKQPMIADLHGKYNCESSLQITKVTEPETNQGPTVLEKQPNSQPSLQIMRIPPAADNSTKPVITETTVSNDGTNGNSSNVPVTVTNKPVNKKPVPSLYSMPTKSRTKEDHNHNNAVTSADSKCVERRVDTENGVLSVSLLTETTKQDMDAKRREIVQPDVSIKLMTFAGTTTTESAKKTPELNPLSSSVKRKQDDMSPIGSVCVSNKKKQDEPERKTTPPRQTSTKDDVPQLIEINSSPYGKLLPSKMQQLTPKPQPLQKQQPASKPQLSPKQQVVQKSQSSPKQLQSKLQSGASPANILDLSKSPPNSTVKRHSTTEVPVSGFSPNKKKITATPVQYAPSTIAAATSAAINSNLLFAAQRQAAAFLLKQHFDTLNNGMIRNGGKGPTDWPRTMFNTALFAKPPPTNLNN